MGISFEYGMDGGDFCEVTYIVCRLVGVEHFDAARCYNTQL